MLLFLFWASIAIIGYTFAGYPLTLALWGAVRPRSWRREPYEPAVSVVIAAHNEAGFMSQKIRNLIALDYPADRLEILIGSDGSTDGTAERILAISEARVRPFIFPQRRGKAEVLNTLIPKARGEIILLADARQTFDPSVLRVLTRSFADPEVGAVSGELVLGRSQPGSAVGNGSGLYWRYEKFIRSRESAVDSSIGATGAIYAIRKSLFQSIPDDTILDDVLIPLRITRGGHRVVFDREALAYDFASAAPGQEFTRKVRTLAGNFQLFARERWLCNPFRNRLWWQVISHKALRLIVAPLQVTVAASNIAFDVTRSEILKWPIATPFVSPCSGILRSVSIYPSTGSIAAREGDYHRYQP